MRMTTEMVYYGTKYGERSEKCPKVWLGHSPENEQCHEYFTLNVADAAAAAADLQMQVTFHSRTHLCELRDQLLTCVVKLTNILSSEPAADVAGAETAPREGTSCAGSEA